MKLILTRDPSNILEKSYRVRLSAEAGGPRGWISEPLRKNTEYTTIQYIVLVKTPLLAICSFVSSFFFSIYTSREKCKQPICWKFGREICPLDSHLYLEDYLIIPAINTSCAHCLPNLLFHDGATFQRESDGQVDTAW